MSKSMTFTINSSKIKDSIPTRRTMDFSITAVESLLITTV
jgi:hypothetical protein